MQGLNRGVVVLATALLTLIAGTSGAYAGTTTPSPVRAGIDGLEPVHVNGMPDSLRGEHATTKGAPLAVATPATKTNAGPDDPVPQTVCTPSIGKNVTLNSNGPWTMRVDFYGDISCTNYVSAYGVAYVYERTNGAPYNGSIVYAGGAFSFNAGTYGASYGSVLVHGGVYDGGQQWEIGLYLQLTTLDGSTWQCQVPIPGVRYLSECIGKGTTSLQVEVGSNIFNTGLYPYMSLPLPDASATRAAYGASHHDHAAIDIPVPVGTPVKAVRDGNITTFYEATGCGYGISIAASDGATYTYCHLSGYTISSGSPTRAGGVIGYSGNTGASTGPHLHVQIRIGGSLRCPQAMLQSIWDYIPPPAASALPVSGCTH